MPKGSAINAMFAAIAGRYDCANHVLSAGVDYYWRWRLVRAVRAAKPGDVADLATGSGDVAFALRRGLAPQVSVLGLDFCEPMLARAEAKKAKDARFGSVRFAVGDCMALPLEDASVDAITIAFGVRNFEDRPRGFREMLRVLRPGGRAFILEFSQPASWLRPFYYVYLKRLLPLVAGVVTGKADAYEYLAGSIESFPARDVLSRELLSAGFSSVKATGLTGSIVALHEARK